MDKWALYEAKNKLSSIIDLAMHGKPQSITKRGEEAVVIIGIKEYQNLQKQKLDFTKFLMSGTKSDQLEINRVIGKAREIEL